MKVMVSVDTKLVGLLGYPLKQTFAPRMATPGVFMPIEMQLGDELGV